LVFLVSAAVAGRLLCGSTGYGWPSEAILHIRLWRAGAAGLVGVALASSGVVLQALVRNPLAEPYILGVSTGAGLGVLIQLYLAQLGWIDPGAGYMGGLAGALINLVIVYHIGRRKGVLDPLGLILAGVVLSTVSGALVMLLQYLAPYTIRQNLSLWIMGYLNEALPPAALPVAGVLIVSAVSVAAGFSRAMDMAGLPDAEAISLGLSIGPFRALLFAIAGVLTASAVVLAGPIAFVGFICPHFARLLVGPLHARVLPTAAILGAALILLADTISAVIHHHAGIGVTPIGIFTAILGGPLFLWMLRPQLGRGVS